jgi:excisionase family DNA binding protein
MLPAVIRGRDRLLRVQIEKGYMVKASHNNEPLLTAEAVSKWLRISAKTLNQWAEAKKIPAVKEGNEWKFRETDLTNWVKKQTRKNK